MIRALNLDEKLAVQNGQSHWSIDDTYDFLSKRVTVEQTRMTSLIEVSVRNSDKDLAAKIVNKVAEAYKEFRIDQWRDSKGGGIKALESRLAVTTNELAIAQSNLDQARISSGITELEEGLNSRTTVLDKALEDWDHTRIMAQADYFEYSNILYELKQIPAENLGAELSTAFPHQLDQEISDLSNRRETARARMLEVERVYGESNAIYQASKKQLDAAEIAYQHKIDGIMKGVEARVTQDRNYLQLIEAQEKEVTVEKNKKASEDRPYYDDKRDVESKRRNYELLVAMLDREIAEQGQPNAGVVTVLNPGRPGKEPVSPKTSLIIPLGVIVGLIVGVGLAFFIEYLDTSVKTIDDVERALSAPVLGVIPQNVGIIMDEGPESPHAEAYRVLRTNLLFSRKNEGWSTLSVLSGGAGEGKSTTLFNLATIFAQNGQRTLVVDSDLRRPTIHKILHKANTIGLTDFLLKQRTLDEVIQKTKIPTLDFLASGKLPSSSMSILGSAQMKETIQELKRRYEFIFFDSPPLLGVSDASILASEMDMVLQVVQYRRYPQPMTLRAKQMVLKVGGNLIGIVLNNINMSQDENYYYYSGYYEYQYQSQQKDEGVVQVPDEKKTPDADIKPKY